MSKQENIHPLSEKDILKLLEQMPKVDAAIIYGSAFFKQSGVETGEKKSYDVMLLVSDPNAWHRQNYAINREDYSYLGRLFLIHNYLPKKVIKNPINQKISCIFKEQYNGNEIKFLIIETAMALHSAYTWDYISIPGRWHKEIKVVVNNLGESLDKALEFNRESAAKVSLIINSHDQISEEEFEETIANISYMKDVRMTTGSEDADKVKNIRDGSKRFLQLHYVNLPFIKKEDRYILNTSKQITTGELPTNMAQYIWSTPEKTRGQVVREYLEKRTEQDSVSLAIRCFCTTGPKKAAQVFIGKKMKALKSKLYKGEHYHGVFGRKNDLGKKTEPKGIKQLAKK